MYRKLILSLTALLLPLFANGAQFSEIPAGADLANIITNAFSGQVVRIGPGGYTINTAVVIPAGVRVIGDGDDTVISNNVTLGKPCFVLGNNTYLGYLRGFCITPTNNFAAFVGTEYSGSGISAFTNAVVDHITYTNGTSDGWYVEHTNQCSADLYACKFQTTWDAGVTFQGPHFFRYFNCSFLARGANLRASVVHGFYNSGGGTNLFFGCQFDGENPATGTVGFTNAYAFAMDGNPSIPVGLPVPQMYVELNGCTLTSGVTNTMVAYDIMNGQNLATNGVLLVNGCNFNPLKTFGPYMSSWLVATGSIPTLVNTNILGVCCAGDAAVNLGYTWFTNVGAVSEFTNIASGGYSISGTANHWTNYDTFMDILYTSTGALPTNANWVVATDTGPAPTVSYGFTLTNTTTVVSSNVIFNGSATVQNALTVNGPGTLNGANTLGGPTTIAGSVGQGFTVGLAETNSQTLLVNNSVGISGSGTGTFLGNQGSLTILAGREYITNSLGSFVIIVSNAAPTAAQIGVNGSGTALFISNTVPFWCAASNSTIVISPIVLRAN